MQTSDRRTEIYIPETEAPHSIKAANTAMSAKHNHGIPAINHSPAEFLDSKSLSRTVSAVCGASSGFFRCISHTYLHTRWAAHRSPQSAVLRKNSEHFSMLFTHCKLPCLLISWTTSRYLCGTDSTEVLIFTQSPYQLDFVFFVSG